jgi:hypothetical protein
MLIRNRRPGSPARNWIIAALAILIAVITGMDWLGKPLRLVHVLTLVADGMVAGTALTRAVMRWRGRAANVNGPAA